MGVDAETSERETERGVEPSRHVCWTGQAQMSLRQLRLLLTEKLPKFCSTDTLFNQYRDADPVVDLRDAARIRLQNLCAYVDSFRTRPTVLLVGEAAGPWGCRFSGVAFTGEQQLCERLVPFEGRRSSSPHAPARSGHTPPYVSDSARAFWQVMLRHHPRFFVWDCVPLHPHRPGCGLSVRTPSSEEIRRFSNLLRDVVACVQPSLVVAVGRTAERALKIICVPCTYVRHRARGGAAKFQSQIEPLLPSR